MELFGFFFIEILFYVQAAFTIWMLVDCYRRGAEGYWFWIVLIFQPIGAWAYFFGVKLGNSRGFRGGSPIQGLFTFLTRPSLEELRYRTRQTPTFANHVALAERLIEKKEYAEAVPHLEAALERESEHGQVLHTLARCHVGKGQPELAVPLLEKILAKDRHWSNYAAWHLLIEARVASGDESGALTTCRELARLTQTLQHRCLLAEHLLANGLTDEARQVLDESLADYQFSPGPIRRRNRQWASVARRLQKQVPLR